MIEEYLLMARLSLRHDFTNNTQEETTQLIEHMITWNIMCNIRQVTFVVGNKQLAKPLSYLSAYYLILDINSIREYQENDEQDGYTFYQWYDV